MEGYIIIIIHVVFQSWDLDICSKAVLKRDIYLTCVEQVFDLRYSNLSDFSLSEWCMWPSLVATW